MLARPNALCISVKNEDLFCSMRSIFNWDLTPMFFPFFVVMKEFGITKVFALDHHFEQMGFILLPSPDPGSPAQPEVTV